MSITAVEDVISQLEAHPQQLRDNWCVPRETGRFLHVVTLISGARRICEVGTSIGYSTLWLARAAAYTNGTVDTLEYFEERQQQAIRHVRRAGLENRVRFHLGAALDVLRQFEAEGRQFDLAFIDAAKKEYIDYVRLLQAMMPRGAVLIADNTRSHRDEMLDFLDYMEQSPLFEVAQVETPNGQLLAYRR